MVRSQNGIPKVIGKVKAAEILLGTIMLMVQVLIVAKGRKVAIGMTKTAAIDGARTEIFFLAVRTTKHQYVEEMCARPLQRLSIDA